MHVLVLAWEPRPVPRVPAWPRVAAIAAALAGSDRRVTVLADATTTSRVTDRLGDVVDVVTAHAGAPHLDTLDLRTTVTSGGLALQTAGAELAADATTLHAVGWQATYGAVALAETVAIPLVASPLHLPRSSEEPDDRWATDVVRWLARDADLLSVASRRLADRLRTELEVARERLLVAPLPRGASSEPDLDAIRQVLLPAHAQLAARRRTTPPGPLGHPRPE